VVILRRLTDARDSGDAIRAVILGSAVNNDGARRAGYAAPSALGQADVIETALAMAGTLPSSMDYIECHGSGTPLGDAIEIAALKRVFGEQPRATPLLIGSVKSNIGHLREAAGIAGLIKTVFALEAGVIPATLHFQRWNPEAIVDQTPFSVATAATAWPSHGTATRRAGVSSFGLGGTNAHLVLGEAPPAAARLPARRGQLLVLSARSNASLERMAAALAAFLEGPNAPVLADVAHTLQQGRQVHPYRLAVVADGTAGAAEALRKPRRAARAIRSSPGIAFLLAGTGDGYQGLGSGLYRQEPAFRRIFDSCLDAARPHLDRDLSGPLGLEAGRAKNVAGDFRTLLRAVQCTPAQELVLAEQHCADFIITYALAQFWRYLGIQPDVLLGYSLGEYTAAALAEIFSLSDAIQIVIRRAKLIERHDGGGMLTVCCPAQGILPWLPPGVEVAAFVAQNLCVVAGTAERLNELQRRLAAEGIAARRLPTRHSIHTSAMTHAASELERLIRSFPRKAPLIPVVSNVTGAALTAAEATDPAYWSRHLTRPVRLVEGIGTLMAAGRRLFIEMGPGQLLSAVTGHEHGGDAVLALASLPALHDSRDDRTVLLSALGRCWMIGAAPAWPTVTEPDTPRRVPLPEYAWERSIQTVRQAIPRRPRDSSEKEVLDRRELHSFQGVMPTGAQATAAAFESPTEAAVSGLFAEMLGRSVPPDADFFEAGGHSLLAVQLLLRLKSTFGQELQISTIYAHRTARQLARWLESDEDTTLR
jgi:acyl transferase domain-containing protein